MTIWLIRGPTSLRSTLMFLFLLPFSWRAGPGCSYPRVRDRRCGLPARAGREQPHLLMTMVSFPAREPLPGGRASNACTTDLGKVAREGGKSAERAP
jgi:hypothetical protein